MNLPVQMTRAKALAAAAELKRRIKSKRVIVDEAFSKQAEFVKDGSRYITAKCTRRAGKSHGLAYKFFNAALKHPRSGSVYIALTRDSAKNIMWPILKDFDEKYKIGAHFKESSLTVDFD